jgi:hypothetical protein
MELYVTVVTVWKVLMILCMIYSAECLDVALCLNYCKVLKG